MIGQRTELSLCPELALWRAILAQVLYDLYNGNPKRTEDIIAKRDAAHFLTKRKQDLKLYCDMAGIDPDYFISKHRRPECGQRLPFGYGGM